jgi:KDO2-lipid IV(A) lauroyltransferase
MTAPSNDSRPASIVDHLHDPVAGRIGLKRRVLVALYKWFGRISPRARRRVGGLLTLFVLAFARRRKHIVRTNLRLCFPNESEAARERILRDHFRALCQSLVDRGVLWYGTLEAIEQMVSISGIEQIQELYAQRRPTMLLAPHFIGLDAAATRIMTLIPLAATMYTPQSDPDVDAIVRAGRGRFNQVHLVNRRDGVRDLVRHLRAGLPTYYLPDMDFGRTGAVFVPFFGVPAATIVATAQLVQKWDIVVLPILEIWDPRSGRYHVEVRPPLRDFPGDASLEEASARLNRELEQWVRRCPSQYYWVHRRFKTRPPGEPKLY